MIRNALASAVLGGAALLASTAFAAQPGERRTGVLEVTVTYAGQSSWKKGVEHGSQLLDRKLTYRVPLIGRYGLASGFREWDGGFEREFAGPVA